MSDHRPHGAATQQLNTYAEAAVCNIGLEMGFETAYSTGFIPVRAAQRAPPAQRGHRDPGRAPGIIASLACGPAREVNSIAHLL
jgi:hypothetical protein